MPTRLQIGFLIFPQITQLDMTGPLQVLSGLPDADIHLVWKRIEPVPSDTVLTLTPTMTLADCPQLDVVCVPGGRGTDALLDDEEVLGFLRRQGRSARFVASVCTGALVLAAAGLLQGYRATTHWTALELLPLLGVEPSDERVCVDRNRVTGGGVTAGIDFGLTLVSILADMPTAQTVQLRLEYNPAPPFAAGSPLTAPPEVLAAMRQRNAPAQAGRRRAVEQAARRLT